MPGIFWIAIAVISITAILAGTYTERKKHEKTLEASNGGSNEEVKMLIAENKEMKERLKNLEAIITSLDEDLLLLNAVETDGQEKVKRLAERLNGGKNE